MATNPNATTSIDDQSGALGTGDTYLAIFSCVERNADLTPRVFTSAKGIQAQHGYSQGADFAATFIDKTGLSVIFVALPTVTTGTIGQQNATGVLGTSSITVAAGSAGVLEEVQGIVNVLTGGTIGTSGIVLSVSMDGGLTFQTFRLGTASSLTIPYLGIVINFAAGTLLAGDVYTFATTAPKWDGAGIDGARTALARQLKSTRSWLIIGDLLNATEAGYITGATNSFETANKRFVYARAQVRDRIPLATKSKPTRTMTGAPSITFTAAGFTITRATGSFISDGFLVGDAVTISGSVSNNGTKFVTGVTATTLTFASGIVNEGPIGTVAIVGTDGLTFATTSITRNAGSWLADGFRVGDTVTISGTVSNNGTKVITALTATVLSFASGGVAETIASTAVTVTRGETMAAWVSAMDSAFSTVDSQRRIDLGLGRLRAPKSQIHSWRLRRPVQWAATIREYQHDLHIPCWRKTDGPLDGWNLDVGDGNILEYTENNDGGGLAARFTCAKTWENGPVGAFIALSLTRAPESSVLSRTHNMAVANLACTVQQLNSEQAVGQSLELTTAGYATSESLALIEGRVNRALSTALLVNKEGEGKRASFAKWKANTTDLLNVPGATLTGVLTLYLNGTIEQVLTSVKINPAT